MSKTQVKTGQQVERGRRIKHVRLALSPSHGGLVSHRRFGELVARQEGRERPFDQSTAKRWEDGAEVGVDTLESICRVAFRYGVRYASRAWVAFGPAGVSEAREAESAPDISRIDAERDAEATEPTPVVEKVADPAPSRSRKRHAAAVSPTKRRRGTR